MKLRIGLVLASAVSAAILVSPAWRRAPAEPTSPTTAPAPSVADMPVILVDACPAPLERRLLEDAADGRLDAFTLFDATLIAGGCPSEDALAIHREQLRGWVDELRATAPEAIEPRAAFIFDFFHRRILFGGYRDDGTDLAEALRDGRYNCVSSSILFQTLANGCDLAVDVVAHPAHVFCRLRTPDGGLDIQTTNPSWAAARGGVDSRAPAGSRSPEDVAAERVLNEAESLAVVYYNQGVVYLQRGEFAAALAANKKALQLDPANTAARANWLATFNNWAVDRGNRGAYGEALALLSAARRLAPDHAPLLANTSALYQQWAAALARERRTAEAAAVLRKGLRDLPRDAALETALRAMAPPRGRG